MKKLLATNTYRTLEVADRMVKVDKAVALSQNQDVVVVVVTKKIAENKRINESFFGAVAHFFRK